MARTRPRDDRPPKPKAESKLAGAVRGWLGEVLPGMTLATGQQQQQEEEDPLAACTDLLVQQAPRRWVVYEPMVLLATGSFGFQAVASSSGDDASVDSGASTSPWQRVLAAATPEQQAALWRAVLAALSPPGGGGKKEKKEPLTHLAVNEGIPLRVDNAGENILRSPTGLRALYGDFGPAAVADDVAGPTDADFAAAFWVSTRQNGVYQTWAPRWSMFSRGNVKEKARLLGWEQQHTTSDKSEDDDDDDDDAYAVDLYAGIGYFVFSYAARGLRVLGWELNPWSAEALRRGALRNGWTVQVVRAGEGAGEGSSQITLFVEDNARAAQRLAALRRRPRVVHSNCGLLPTSRDSWRTAWDAVVEGAPRPWTGWLHLHENVGAADVEARRDELQTLVSGWAAQEAAAKKTDARVQHVELVKTFAPGVWHCVFDVCLSMR